MKKIMLTIACLFTFMTSCKEKYERPEKVVYTYNAITGKVIDSAFSPYELQEQLNELGESRKYQAIRVEEYHNDTIVYSQTFTLLPKVTVEKF